MEIGARIREIRKKLGLTLQQMGEEIGIAHNTLSQVERSQRQVSQKLITALMKHYNVSADWVFTGSGSCFMGSSPYSEMTFSSEVHDSAYVPKQGPEITNKMVLHLIEIIQQQNERFAQIEEDIKELREVMVKEIS